MDIGFCLHPPNRPNPGELAWRLHPWLSASLVAWSQPSSPGGNQKRQRSIDKMQTKGKNRSQKRWHMMTLMTQSTSKYIDTWITWRWHTSAIATTRIRHMECSRAFSFGLPSVPSNLPKVQSFYQLLASTMAQKEMRDRWIACAAAGSKTLLTYTHMFTKLAGVHDLMKWVYRSLATAWK